MATKDNVVETAVKTKKRTLMGDISSGISAAISVLPTGARAVNTGLSSVGDVLSSIKIHSTAMLGEVYSDNKEEFIMGLEAGKEIDKLMGYDK